MIVQAQDHFGRAVEAALDVRVHCYITMRDWSSRKDKHTLTFLMFKATATKVDDLETALSGMAQKDILQYPHVSNYAAAK